MSSRRISVPVESTLTWLPGLEKRATILINREFFAWCQRITAATKVMDEHILAPGIFEDLMRFLFLQKPFVPMVHLLSNLMTVIEDILATENDHRSALDRSLEQDSSYSSVFKECLLIDRQQESKFVVCIAVLNYLLTKKYVVLAVQNVKIPRGDVTRE